MLKVVEGASLGRMGEGWDEFFVDRTGVVVPADTASTLLKASELCAEGNGRMHSSVPSGEGFIVLRRWEAR